MVRAPHRRLAAYRNGHHQRRAVQADVMENPHRTVAVTHCNQGQPGGLDRDLIARVAQLMIKQQGDPATAEYSFPFGLIDSRVGIGGAAQRDHAPHIGHCVHQTLLPVLQSRPTMSASPVIPAALKNDRWYESLFGAPPPSVSHGATRRAIPAAEIVGRVNDFGGWYQNGRTMTMMT